LPELRLKEEVTAREAMSMVTMELSLSVEA